MKYLEPDRRYLIQFCKALVLGCFILLCGAAPALANYTFILKNGRQITVQTYHEEDQMMRLSVQGGEITIGKEQIESIVQSSEVLGRAGILPSTEMVPGETAQETTKAGQQGVGAPSSTPTQEDAEKGVVSQAPKEKMLTPEERRAEQRAKEEKKYQTRVRETTGRIKALMDRYSLATRGKTGPDPTVLKTPEAISSRTADLKSRLKDSQYNSIRLRSRRAIRRVNPPLSPYSQKEKELSDLRKQINQLHNERALLIQEMRQKNFNTGSLFMQ